METTQYTRITVPLSRQEWEALRDVSQLEYRHPREQARYLLRQMLLGDPITSTNLNVIQPSGDNRSPVPDHINATC